MKVPVIMYIMYLCSYVINYHFQTCQVYCEKRTDGVYRSVSVLGFCHELKLITGSYYEDLEWQYFSINNEEIEYLNSWAVYINGSLDVVNSIADKYGFVNKGKIGILENYYHFILPHGRNVYLESVSKILLSERNVCHVQQQKKALRVKKSFNMPNDPLWKHQWSMFNTGEVTKGRSNLDINVVRAWLQGITGKSVLVTVIDDGIDHYHVDIVKNYDEYASYNYAEYKLDPLPLDLYTETHGTMIAGVIGMQKNSVCGAGVAHNVKIGGIRVDLKSMTDLIESCALGHYNSHIQIYSNGWGPSDEGYSLDGPGALVRKTFEKAATMGRTGLGNIYIWAAGNGGLNGDMCSCDGYASSMYTVAVGSADERGRQAPFDENCPAKIAVTFSYNSQSSTQLPTISTQNQCTSSFTGTSASASLTSGVIALALEVNPSLSWRDIQYILVYSSNPYKLEGGNWTQTDAGLRVSPQFGFGAIDAEAIVMRAKYWTALPQRLSCLIRPDVTSAYVYNSSPFTSSIYVGSSYCPIVYLEHVVLHATINIKIDDHDDFLDYYDEDYVYENPFIIFFKGPRRGAISIKLVSPHGTPSYLLEKRPHDFVNSKGFEHWPFMSVHHWGEYPLGYWSLYISFDAEGGHIEVSNISMTIYGTSEIPDPITSASSTCNESCARGCSHNGSSVYCDACKNLRMADSLLCVASCPDGYCIVGGYCIVCPATSAMSGGTIAGVVIGSFLGTTLLATTILLILLGICIYKKKKQQSLSEGFTKF